MNPDFLDLLRELSGADARFMIVGAYAVSYHSQPRATGDLDIWIEATQENSLRVFEALSRFGAPLSQLSLADLSEPGIVFQMGLPPRRIDLLTSITGVTFEEAWPGRSTLQVEGVWVHLLGKEALLRNKRALGRPKDLLDVAMLEKAPP